MSIFKNEPAELKRFLNTSVAIAMARREWKFSLQVSKADLVDALKILRTTWNPSSGLSFQLQEVYKAANNLSSPFKASVLRKKTNQNPKSTERSIRALIEKGYVKKVGGDRYQGYLYKTVDKEYTRPDYTRLEKAIKNLK